MHWYDGGNMPPTELFKGVTLDSRKIDRQEVQAAVRRAACLLIGDKATMYAAGDYAEQGIQIVGDAKEMDVDYPA